MLIQSLETRRLFSSFFEPVVPSGIGDIGSSLSHGVLRINGSNDLDIVNIEVGQRTIKVEIQVLPPPGVIVDQVAIPIKEYRLRDIDRIVVELGNQDDQIDLSGLNIPAAIAGGNGNDTIIGSQRRDTIKGGLGNDQVDGAGGGDVILAGRGDDRITGGDGDDALFGDSGRDRLTTGAGHDVVDGGTGSDFAQIDELAASVTNIQRFQRGSPTPLEIESDQVRFAIGRELEGTPVLVQVAIGLPDSADRVSSGLVRRDGSQFSIDIYGQRTLGISLPAYFTSVQEFPLSRLPNGTYSFVVRSGGQIIATTQFVVRQGWRGEEFRTSAFPTNSPVKTYSAPVNGRPWLVSFGGPVAAPR